MNPNSAFPTPTPEEEATLRALDSLENVVADPSATPSKPPVKPEAKPAPALVNPAPRPVVAPRPAPVPQAPKPAPVAPKPTPPVVKPAPAPQPKPAAPAPKPAPVVPEKPKRTADDPTGIKAEIASAPSRPIYDFFAAQNKRFRKNKGVTILVLVIFVAILAAGGYFGWQYYITQ